LLQEQERRQGQEQVLLGAPEWAKRSVGAEGLVPGRAAHESSGREDQLLSAVHFADCDALVGAGAAGRVGTVGRRPQQQKAGPARGQEESEEL